MKEPDIEAQIKELDEKKLAGLIDKKEYCRRLAMISKGYDEWLRTQG